MWAIPHKDYNYSSNHKIYIRSHLLLVVSGHAFSFGFVWSVFEISVPKLLLPLHYMGTKETDCAEEAIDKLHLITATCDSRNVQLLWISSLEGCSNENRDRYLKTLANYPSWYHKRQVRRSVLIVINRVCYLRTNNWMWCPHNAEWDPVQLSNNSWLNRWYYVDIIVLACISVIKFLAGRMWCHLLALLLPSAVSQSVFVDGMLKGPKEMVVYWEDRAYASTVSAYNMKRTHVLERPCVRACALCLLRLKLSRPLSHTTKGDTYSKWIDCHCHVEVSLLFSNKSIERGGARESKTQYEGESEHPGCLTWLGYVNKISVVKAAAVNNREHRLMSNGMYRDRAAVCVCVCSKWPACLFHIWFLIGQISQQAYQIKKATMTRATLISPSSSHPAVQSCLLFIASLSQSTSIFCFSSSLSGVSQMTSLHSWPQ